MNNHTKVKTSNLFITRLNFKIRQHHPPILSNRQHFTNGLTCDIADGEIGLLPASISTLWLQVFEFYLCRLIIRGRVFTSAIVDLRRCEAFIANLNWACGEIQAVFEYDYWRVPILFPKSQMYTAYECCDRKLYYRSRVGQ